MPLLLSHICFTLLVVLWGGLNSSAQLAPNWEWFTPVRTTQDVNDSRIAIDAAGNSYVVGQFAGRATFGATTLTSRGWYDMFLAKYDTYGRCLWARQAGPAIPNPVQFGSYILMHGIGVDGYGNAYVTGVGQGRISFDNTEITTINDRYERMFVAKYSAQGRIVWARTYDLGWPGDIAPDQDGSVYVVHGASPNGVASTLVSKLDARGNPVWTRGARSSGSHGGRSQVKIGPNHEVYLCGDYRFGASIDVSAQANNPLPTAGLRPTGLMNSAVFLARYTASGTLDWVRTGCSPGESVINAGLAVDGAGNAFISGIGVLAGPVFGSGAFTTRGDQDIYVVKYNAQGQVLWARQEGGNPSHDYSNGIATDESGNAYLIGTFEQGQASFSGIVLNGDAVARNLALIKYDPQGRGLWGMTQQGGGNMAATGLAVNRNGDVYITGEYYNSVQLGAHSSTVASGTPYPSREVFTAKLKSNLPLVFPGVPLFIPNIITPNGDGQNDQFNIIGLEWEQLSCRIYSRWGNKVFDAPQYQQDWQADGLSDGIYYYVIENGKGQVNKGWVEVRR